MAHVEIVWADGSRTIAPSRCLVLGSDDDGTEFTATVKSLDENMISGSLTEAEYCRLRDIMQQDATSTEDEEVFLSLVREGCKRGLKIEIEGINVGLTHLESDEPGRNRYVNVSSQGIDLDPGEGNDFLLFSGSFRYIDPQELLKTLVESREAVESYLDKVQQVANQEQAARKRTGIWRFLPRWRS